MNLYNPKFSFIIPCWEQTDLLKVQLQSIVCQTYKDWETILIHDGINKHHELKIAEYLLDSRFKYFSTPKKHGWPGNYGRQEGIKLATGNWIINTNDDNYYTPNLLQEIVDVINNNDTNINFIYWEMILGKYQNQHSHNQKDYGHFIPQIKSCYIDWGQFATKQEIIKKYSINISSLASDGDLVEDMKHELIPYFIDKCLFVHN
jgi:glycosyltransferase involved in cell wall biosynthesis